MYREEDVAKFEQELNRAFREISNMESKLQEFHQSAKRAGSSRGYLKSLQKLQGCLRWVQEVKRDFKQASAEHIKLLNDGRDSEKNQNYNYSKVSLNKLPVRKTNR